MADGGSFFRAHPVTEARRSTRRRLADHHAHASRDAGFTLVELVIVIAILPIVLGAISVALISVFSLQGATANRIGNSNDALVASSNFNKDVQSALEMTTELTGTADPTHTHSPGCGAAAQNQVLGLEWGSNSAASGGFQTVVSYVSSPVVNGGTTTYQLVRQVCTSGQSLTPTDTRIISYDLSSTVSTSSVFVCGSPQASTDPKCNSFANITSLFSSSWFSTEGVTKVALNVDEAGSHSTGDYTYQLAGIPSQGVSQSTGTTTTLASTGNECEFAAAGTGTYASQLCFVDFTGFNGNTATSQSTCQQMSGPIENTPYSVSFCMWAVPNQYNAGGGCTGYVATPVTPFPIPTYYVTGQSWDSEAFLGNNGFYTGLTENPALYQNVTSDGNPTHQNPPNSSCEWQLSTIDIKNFQVYDAAGDPASGWTLVTGDAESTDSGEWSVYQNLSGNKWSVLDNNGPSDPYGNACYDSGDTIGGANVGFLGYTAAQALSAGTNIPAADKVALPTGGATFPQTGTTSVLCESDQQLNKTGTLMLAAQQSTAGSQSIQVIMNGHGWGQAMFVGVLL
jgi:prepilin-type N-terminal cleavage/methylation domain-containing protein